MDRFDLQVTISRLDLLESRKQVETGEPSATVREQAIECRAIYEQRAGKPKTRHSSKDIDGLCGLCWADIEFLEQAMQRLQLSGLI